MTVLRNTGQVLCRVSLNLGSSDGSPVVRLGSWVWAVGETPEVNCPLSVYPGNHTMNMTYPPVMLILTAWLRWCLLDFSTVNGFKKSATY